MTAKIGFCLLVGLLAAEPLLAAELIDPARSTLQRGAFAGARLRVPLGARDAPRFGVALAPTQRERETGATALAAGLELGFTGRGHFELAAAGKPLRFDGERKSGVSTLGWIGIGAGVALVVGGLLFIDAVRDSSD
ncbi:hypothetical protein [Sphingosinicella sp. BN140058]|uniref:hypothetical protein n=1 Tax=Sphingosinicella sp. BN140058 TaxID=1892855 RepID=UPI0010115F13|nr:hypothetical protein [Sphingosinicella sp. BN140058]QAY75927.1 hypothetical protein ETR14_04835 [Sphingosinicella sp. BN140058]